MQSRQTPNRPTAELGTVILHYAPLRFIVLVLVIAVLLSTVCRRTKSPEASDLPMRIAAANRSQPCHLAVGCVNPHILVFESGYDVMSFVGGTPQHTIVHPDKLRQQLLALPMNAWPQGPLILMTASDDVMDWESIKRNMTEAERICLSLGLDVQFRPGG